MNACDNQRFLVRWKPINPEAKIEVVYGYSPEDPGYPLSVPSTGSAGWLAGCKRLRAAGIPPAGLGQRLDAGRRDRRDPDVAAVGLRSATLDMRQR